MNPSPTSNRVTPSRAAIAIALAALALTVSPALPGPQGQVAWRVSIDGTPSDFSPAVGPDGAVYTGSGDAVTAVASDGTVLWSVAATARQGQVAVGLDGTVYAVTGTSSVVALDAAGNVLWTFDGGDEIVAGPNVGPDGNVYAAANTQFAAIGMFSLTPAGSLRWSEIGDPMVADFEGNGHVIAFGADRVFTAMVPGIGNPPPNMWAFDFDGDQQFVLGTGCEGQPAVGPLNRLVTGNGLCQEIRAYDAAGGSLLIALDPPSPSPCSGLANVAVGPDGTIYSAFCYRAFWAVNPDGSLKWFDDDFGFYYQIDNLGVAPDNSVILDLGRTGSLQGRVRAFSPADGSVLWQIVLPAEDGLAIGSINEPAFDAARGRAYFNAYHGPGSGQGFLYAIDLDPSPRVPGDVDGDGTVGTADVLSLLAAWGPCGDCASCPADLDGDCQVSAADLLLLLASWG